MTRIYLDNGFHRPARGSAYGYYRLTYRGMSPILLRNPEPRPALRVAMRPWRKGGRQVVLALPGLPLAAPSDSTCPAGSRRSRRTFATDRQILIRPKYSAKPLAGDLCDAWALVTHSTNVAVEAVLAGIPVFVTPTSPGVDLSWLTRRARVAACPCP